MPHPPLNAPVALSLLGLLLLAGCPDSTQPDLHVDVVTDLVPFAEFEALRLRVGEGEFAFVQDFIADGTLNYVRGIRLESVPVTAGATVIVSVTAFYNGTEVVQTRVLVDVAENSLPVTVLLSRDCRGVICPAASSSPTLTACLGGRCVDPRCTPETPEHCPPPLCESADECEVASCAQAYCTGGVCLSSGQPSACPSGEYCDGSLGCQPIPIPMDGGMDGGTDGGVDGGMQPGDSGLLLPPAIHSPASGVSTGNPLAPTRSGHDPRRPVFRWSAVSGASRYQLQLTRECDSSLDCGFAVLAVDQSIARTKFQPDSLPVSMSPPIGSRYYWRVRACQAAAEDTCSAWSDTHYVDVGQDPFDTDGDGYSDLVIGASGAASGGGAYVFLGSSSGVSGTPSVSLVPPTLQADQAFGGPCKIVGDLNADGYAEVAVAGTGFDGAETEQGVVYVFQGGPGGPADPIVLPAPAPERQGFFGSSFAGPIDLNADGFDDLVVGAPWSSGQRGNVYVYYGSATGIDSAPSVNLTNPITMGNGRFGEALASLDTNGDGLADLVVGTPNQGGAVGVIYIFHGQVGGIDSVPSTSLSSPSAAGGRFGEALEVAGDVDGDGHLDLIVGAPSLVTEGHQGIVFIFRSGPGGLIRAPLSTFRNTLDRRFFGTVFSGWDADGDGFAEVGIGTYHFSSPAADEVLVLVYQGTPTGPGPMPTTQLQNPSHQDFSLFGIEVASVGDLNGDGYADMAAGNPHQQADAFFEGAAYIYYGGGFAVPEPDPKQSGG